MGLIVLFIIPISVQNYLYWSQSTDQIASTTKEISGADELLSVYNNKLSAKTHALSADMVDEGLAKLLSINDDSGIILDPDPDSFYLGDIVTTKLPAMVRHQVWFDVIAKHGEQVTQKETSQLAIELDRFIGETKDIMNETQKAVQGNSDGLLAGAVQDQIQ
jgi:hypothetical protein